MGNIAKGKCTRCGQESVDIKESRPDEGAVVLSCGCKLSASSLALMGLRLAGDGKTLESVK